MASVFGAVTQTQQGERLELACAALLACGDLNVMVNRSFECVSVN